MSPTHFRFEDLAIWKSGMALSIHLFKICADLDARKQYSFSDQLRRATISITNNIAEGSGSNSKKDFCHFLNIAKRSVFECANLSILLDQQGFISKESRIFLFQELDTLSRKITNFQKSLQQ